MEISNNNRVISEDCDGKEAKPFNLSQYIVRQRHLLHGQQFRNFKYLPRIVYVICERLLHLNGEIGNDYNPKAVSLLFQFLSMSKID